MGGGQSLKLSHSQGFTLAEVLITLGIIGVVAALTIPNLVANHRAKELEIALKKNASIIQQALNLANEEEGETITSTSIPSRSLKEKLKPYLNVLKDCGFGTELGACVPNVAYEHLQEQKNIYRTYSKTRNIDYSLLDDGQLLLTDGTLIMFENSDPQYKAVFISVDINGINKGPNAWGHDLFTFDLTEEGKLLPMGAPHTHYDICLKTSSGERNGIGCTYKAMTDPNYFKQLP